MKTKAILFDLDGTLLPMVQEEFMDAYFGGLCRRFEPRGFEAGALVKAIWTGTKAMVKNDGRDTNENVFWKEFCTIFPNITDDDIAEFERFYIEDFDSVQSSCGYDVQAAEAVKAAKDKGLRVILATNPLFPSIATEKRMAWAGFVPSDFESFTSYESSHYTKPNIGYYKEILANAGLDPHECIMVGNDVDEDMVTESIGMKVFLLTDNLINKNNKDISLYPNGGFSDLIEYIKGLQ